MYGYIYKITNKINGKMYIGQHQATQYEPEIYRGSGKLLLQAYEKYGVDNFHSELLCECYDQAELDAMEIKYIQEYNTTDLSVGYNLTPGGYGGSGPVSEETKRKLSSANEGLIFVHNNKEMFRIQPEDYDIYVAQGFVRGVLPFERSEEFKRKLSESTTGKKGMYRVLPDGKIETCWAYPDSWEELLSEGWNFGWKPKQTKEDKPKEPKRHMYKEGVYKQVPLSEVDEHLQEGWIFQCSTKGRVPWNKDKKMSEEYCQKLSAAHTGEKHPPERVEKHAAQLRGRVYMHKDGVSKLIPFGEEEKYTLEGWLDGRVSLKSDADEDELMNASF